MKKKIQISSILLAALLSAQSMKAQDKIYTEGTVWNVTMVRIHPGMDDAYLSELYNGWRKINDEAMKQGLIVSYKILNSEAANPDDFNMLLMVEAKNWAAYDGVSDKYEAITRKFYADRKAEEAGYVKRAEMRDIFGSKNMQELKFK